MPDSLVKKLKKTTRLPSPPGTALEILRLSQQDDVSIGDLASTVASDPALSVRLLKYANSAMVGMSKEVTSVRDAVMLLGIRSVRLMALSFSLVSTNDGAACPGFDYGQFWSHSVACAVACRYLARQDPRVAPEEAFAGGLLSHIGKLVLAVGMPREYSAILEKAGGTLGDTRQKEHEKFGISYPKLGSQLLEEWGIPGRLACAIRCQLEADNEDTPEDLRFFATLLGNAARIADFLCQHPLNKAPAHTSGQHGESTHEESAQPGNPANGGNEESDDQPFEPLVQCGLFDTAEAACETVDAICKEFKELATILSLHQGIVNNAAEIQAQAGEALGELSLAAQFKSDAIEKENKGLQQKAFTDALTGIPNRAAFDRRLCEAWAEAVRASRPLGLVMLDVDHFKKFNDTFGHRTGDAVLKSVANCLPPCVRSVDFVARYGGEEFAAIFPNVDRLTAAQLCVKMRKAVEDCVVDFEEKQHRVTVSLGSCVLVCPGPPFTPHMLIEVTDQLLYRSKQKGRNCCSMKQIQPAGQLVTST